MSLHYNGANSYLFVNGTEIYKFKAKDSKIVATLLYLGNISKDWSVDNMKKTGFAGYIYDFSVDYDAIENDDVKDFHKHLRTKNNIVWYARIKMFVFIRNIFLTGLAFFIKFSKYNPVKLYFND